MFENYIYEKLIRYAIKEEYIEKFILKGPHNKNSKAIPNTLSVNSKGQIVYRNRSKEIGEFDGIFTTKNGELFFVEMTLVKSVTNLKRRLRKKIALLQTIFPQYEIRSLIILNDGATGIKQLPSYCDVWVTKPYLAKHVLKFLTSKKRPKLKPFERLKSDKLVGTEALEIERFNYYGTLFWIYKKLRGSKHLLNMGFLRSKTVTRYIDLFTKIYIGHMSKEEFAKLAPKYTEKISEKVVVSIEKEHTDELKLIYFMLHSRKNLEKISFEEEEIKIVKKDPYGISVTEVIHMLKKTGEEGRLNAKNIRLVERLLEEHNAKLV